MTGLDHVETDRLREWLSEVREGRTTAALMLAVAYDKGIGAGELASWYGRSTESVEEAIAAIDSPSHVAEIARLEGVDVDVVDVPFAELSGRPVPEAASAIRDHADGTAESGDGGVGDAEKDGDVEQDEDVEQDGDVEQDEDAERRSDGITD